MPRHAVKTPSYRIKWENDLERCVQAADHLSQAHRLLYIGHGRTEESDVCVKLGNVLRRKIARAERKGV
jgi:hypothetical protein